MSAVEQTIRDYARAYSHTGRFTPETPLICGWIAYMGATYGGTCYPVDRSEKHNGYDWGQAIMRQQFGLEWGGECNRNDLPDAETWRLALAWAEGEWPKWAEKLEARKVVE